MPSYLACHCKTGKAKSRHSSSRASMITAVLAPHSTIPLGTRAASSFNPGDASLTQKYYLWKGVLQLIRERPLFGWGFNNLAGRLPGLGTDEYAKVFGNPNVIVDVAHNDILHIAFCTGLAGLAAYLWVWGVVLYAVWRTVRARSPAFDERSRMVAAFGCALVAYFGWAQFGWTHIGPANVFWTFAGMTVALAASRRTPEAEAAPIGQAQPLRA